MATPLSPGVHLVSRPISTTKPTHAAIATHKRNLAVILSPSRRLTPETEATTLLPDNRELPDSQLYGELNRNHCALKSFMASSRVAE
jgi:hypothetical protein